MGNKKLLFVFFLGVFLITPFAYAQDYKFQPNLSSEQETPLAESANTTSDVAEESKEPADIVVELYTTSWCPYCKDARKFFLSRGISFSEYDIEKDEEAARRKNELDNSRGVPFAIICGQPVRGFSTVAYERALASCER